MAETDFYKAEIERQQEKLKDWHRVSIEASGVMSKLGGMVPHTISPQDMVRRVYDKAESLNIQYKELVADFMFVKGALDELIQAARVELSDAWIDLSDGTGENCNEFSIAPDECPRLVKYLRQKQCCGDARCYNKSSGVECSQDSPLTELTKMMDAEGVYDRKLPE